MSRWVWIRHAPIKNPVQGFCGVTDKDAITDNITPLNISADTFVICSPLKRCLQTAQAFNLKADLICKDFKEQNFGEWEGQAYPEADHLFWKDPANYRPPDGESFADLCARVTSVIDTVTAPNIMCVAHAGVIRAALCHALQIQPKRALFFEIKNLKSTTLNKVEDEWIVEGVNTSLEL